MLCNAIIQSHFDYACSAWYLNLNEKLKKNIKITQNKCIQFCLKLDKRHYISGKEFESINWLPVSKRVYQCINAITFKFVNNACPHYLSELYEYVPQCRIESRSNFAKLKVPFQKTNMWQNGLSYIGPSLWSNLLGSLKKKKQFWILLSINWKEISWQFSWKLGFMGLLLVFTYIRNSFIYLFIFQLIFLSHLFSFLFLTFIWPIYHFLYLLSQSILYYLLWILFVILFCS